jgi:hypothetical protein
MLCLWLHHPHSRGSDGNLGWHRWRCDHLPHNGCSFPSELWCENIICASWSLSYPRQSPHFHTGAWPNFHHQVCGHLWVLYSAYSLASPELPGLLSQQQWKWQQQPLMCWSYGDTGISRDGFLGVPAMGYMTSAPTSVAKSHHFGLAFAPKGRVQLGLVSTKLWKILFVSFFFGWHH